MTASKLEYVDDVGLLDWTAAEASERVDGDVGDLVEGHACAHPKATTRVDGSVG